MTIIISNNHKETKEVEFPRRHPDIFSTCVAAGLVERLAEETANIGDIGEFRADLNVQSFALDYEEGGITPIKVSVAGQVIIPDSLDLGGIVRETVIGLLERAGYFRYGDFSPDKVEVDFKFTPQSLALNDTSRENRFADSCVVYGHYIAHPFGVNGTFPSLIIGQRISRVLEDLVGQAPFLRPDGKVYVTTRYTEDGFIVEDVHLSIAHEKNIEVDFRSSIREEIVRKVRANGLEKARIRVNPGGKFDVYFLQADSGLSKAKDRVIITGGIHDIGTDGVWGKCLHKASSIGLPYVFALSKAVCDVTGARYSSVSGAVKITEPEIEHLEIWDLDPEYEHERGAIRAALNTLPKDVQGIRDILGMNVNLGSYRAFNDVAGFHSNDKPWKRHNSSLEKMFRQAYSDSLVIVNTKDL